MYKCYTALKMFVSVQECLSVQLDRKTAWLIYQSVKTSIILERSRLQQEQQQLEKGELNCLILGQL